MWGDEENRGWVLESSQLWLAEGVELTSRFDLIGDLVSTKISQRSPDSWCWERALNREVDY